MRWLGGLVGRRAGRVGEMVDWKAVIAVVERDKGGVGAGLGEFKTFPEGACIFVGGWGALCTTTFGVSASVCLGLTGVG